MTRSLCSRSALRVVDAIVGAAQLVPNCPLREVLSYGNTFAAGIGCDIDIVLVVERTAFESYVGNCVLSHDGLRPFSDDVLNSFHSRHLETFSPQALRRLRSKIALSEVGVDVSTLALTEMQKNTLDIVCLPLGWHEESGEIHDELSDSLVNSGDPFFLHRAVRTSIQLFVRE